MLADRETGSIIGKDAVEGIKGISDGGTGLKRLPFMRFRLPICVRRAVQSQTQTPFRAVACRGYSFRRSDWTDGPIGHLTGASA
jgi:hypothetical protein